MFIIAQQKPDKMVVAPVQFRRCTIRKMAKGDSKFYNVRTG